MDKNEEKLIQEASDFKRNLVLNIKYRLEDKTENFKALMFYQTCLETELEKQSVYFLHNLIKNYAKFKDSADDIESLMLDMDGIKDCMKNWTNND